MSLMVLQGKAKGKGKLRYHRKDVQSPHASRAAGQEQATGRNQGGEAEGWF